MDKQFEQATQTKPGSELDRYVISVLSSILAAELVSVYQYRRAERR
jgi:hypothetical protein